MADVIREKIAKIIIKDSERKRLSMHYGPGQHFRVGERGVNKIATIEISGKLWFVVKNNNRRVDFINSDYVVAIICERGL